MMPSISIRTEDKRYDPITLSIEKMNGDTRSTVNAMEIPPNFGVGYACICLFPGRSTTPLLFASVINRGTAENEIIKERKIIAIVNAFLLLISSYCNY
jgi:hypothetical protein